MGKLPKNNIFIQGARCHLPRAAIRDRGVRVRRVCSSRACTQSTPPPPFQLIRPSNHTFIRSSHHSLSVRRGRGVLYVERVKEKIYPKQRQVAAPKEASSVFDCDYDLIASSCQVDFVLALRTPDQNIGFSGRKKLLFYYFKNISLCWYFLPKYIVNLSQFKLYYEWFLTVLNYLSVDYSKPWFSFGNYDRKILNHCTAFWIYAQKLHSCMNVRRCAAEKQGCHFGFCVCSNSFFNSPIHRLTQRLHSSVQCTLWLECTKILWYAIFSQPVESLL